MVMYASYEDYLYILLGIVWVIFSYYKAQSKKKAKESQNSNKESKPSFLETLINEMGLKAEEEPVYADPVYGDDIPIEKSQTSSINEDDNITSKVFSYDDYYEESNYSPTSDVNDKKPTIKDVKVTTTISRNNTSKNMVRKVDLKKAIIYSEILKKRYF